MKRYILFCAFISCSVLAFCQSADKTIKRKIDSLQRLLPGARDSARVDILNSLATTYDLVFADQKSGDSSYASALEAYALSKAIGYKKGMAYALIQLGSEQTLKINRIPEQGNHATVIKMLADSCEYYCGQAVRIGQELNNNNVLGSAYYTLADLVFSKNRYNIKDKKENQRAEELLQKALSYFETQNDHNGAGNVCRDLFSLYNDRGDREKTRQYITKAVDHLLKSASERSLGDLYLFNLSPIHKQWNDKAAEEDDLNKAVLYYTRSEEIQKLLNALSRLKYLYPAIDRQVNFEQRLINVINELRLKGNEEGEYTVSLSLAWQYTSTGEFEKGFPLCEKCIRLSEKLAPAHAAGNSIWGVPYFYMSRFYKYAGDYNAALSFLQKARKWYGEEPGNLTAEIGDIYRILKQYDSALYYLKPFATVKRNNGTVLGIAALANLNIDLAKNDEAITLIREAINTVNQFTPDLNGPNYTTLAKAMAAKNNYTEALNAAKTAASVLKKEVNKIRMMENYEILARLFHLLKNNDSAYHYLQQYVSLKDSILNRQFYWRLNSYRKQAEEEKRTSQINLLNKDNQLKQQKLNQAAIWKKSLIAGIFLLFILGVFIFRNMDLKRRSTMEKNKLEMEKKLADLKMQALRAQMNPHFIFNCLSSINRFILKNETKAASNYLTRFSRLIRMVLNNSQKPLITLEDELEMLTLYLEMERLRFKDSFDYFITFMNRVDTGNTFVPPLILQPFCENAIWHGLMHKEAHGRLDIQLQKEDNSLHCVIRDNGIGREKAAAFKEQFNQDNQPMGLNITTERLAIYNGSHDTGPFYKVEDLKDENGMAAGTQISLAISIRETTEV